MTPEQIQAMAKGLALENAIWYVLSICTVGVVAYFAAYLGEKGKGRATKDDVREITNAIGEINNKYSVILSKLNARNQLSMLVPERRLEAHQQAYALWYTMFHECRRVDGQGLEASKDCKLWFMKNCMFLGPKSRDAFKRAYLVAEEHLEARERKDASAVRATGAILGAPLEPLFQEVNLPPLSLADVRDGDGESPA